MNYLSIHRNILKIPIVNGNFVNLTFGPIVRPVLIDTGATISMISTNLLQDMDPDYKRKLQKGELHSAKLIDNSKINIDGEIEITLTLYGKPFGFVFQVLSNMSYWAVIGIDFMDYYDCLIDYDKGYFVIPIGEIEPPDIKVNAAQNSVEHTQNLDEDLHGMELCDAPQEAHDLAYYQRTAVPIQNF